MQVPDQRAIEARYRRSTLPLKAVRVTPLDEHKNPISAPGGIKSASGFIRREGDGNYLYVCWHTLTGGIDKNNPRLPPAPVVLPRYLRAGLLNVEQLPGRIGERIGGLREIDFSLYDESGTPAWLQDVQHIPHSDLNGIGIYVPLWHDAAKLRIPDSVRLSELQHNDRSDVITPEIGDKILIVGYPFGYSAHGHNQPMAIVLTRFVASMSLAEKRREVLLDGEGAPGMSGGPVFVERDSMPYPVGIYTGNIMPGTASNPLRLGTFCDLSMCWHVPNLTLGHPTTETALKETQGS